MRATAPGGHLPPGAFGRVQGADLPPGGGSGPAHEAAGYAPVAKDQGGGRHGASARATALVGQKKNESLIQTCHPVGTPLSTGIVLMDLDALDDFQIQTTVVEKHARSCPAGLLKVVKQKKEGKAGTCKKIYKFATGPKKDPGAVQKRGRQMRPINKIMTSSIFKSGCVRAQVQEMFEEAGIVCPSHKGLEKMMEKINGACWVCYFICVYLFCP